MYICILKNPTSAYIICVWWNFEWFCSYIFCTIFIFYNEHVLPENNEPILWIIQSKIYALFGSHGPFIVSQFSWMMEQFSEGKKSGNLVGWQFVNKRVG